MIGAIIGDIVGSRFEWHNHRSKDFDLLTHKCFFTDDSVMSLAVCDALMKCKADYSDLSEQAVHSMQDVGRPYPLCGYGGSFRRWMYSDNPMPYNSYGNGAAMRVSGCGYVGKTIDEVKQLSKAVTEVTHNHPEGLKGAEATAVAVFLARTGKSLIEIQDYIIQNYYPLGFTLNSIRENYQFNETCQDTVPQALEAFFESTDFEDAIRNAISIGGDSDTLAAITGSVAEAYYGVPTSIRKHALTFLDERLLRILLEFENRYPAKTEKKNDIGSVGIPPSTGKKVKTGGRAEMIESAMDVADLELDASTAHPEETTSQKLFSHLFEACNILRGPINQDEYKSYATQIVQAGEAAIRPDDPIRGGYTFIGWDKVIPATMPAENITITARWKDIEKPTGEIIIGTDKWQEFLNKLTFGLFFKDAQEVTINAADNSGTVFISYLVTDQDLSEEELKSLVYRGYEEPFHIEPNGEYIVYVMLVDASLNITYLRSDRLTLDNVQPVISGIENGKTYCGARTVTITEKYIDTVTVNGTTVELDESDSFRLAPANGGQKIIVADKAGNTTEMTVTVNDGHTYGEWASNGDGTHTRKCTVDGCAGSETKGCSGGKATCRDKAKCAVCGKTYGELDAKNHADLKHIPAKAATWVAEGNIEYWYCEGCGRYFSDRDGTKEIRKADTVTAKRKSSSAAAKPEDDPKSPGTGDTSNLALWIALLLASGGAAIGTTVVSRKKYNR